MCAMLPCVCVSACVCVSVSVYVCVCVCVGVCVSVCLSALSLMYTFINCVFVAVKTIRCCLWCLRCVHLPGQIIHLIWAVLASCMRVAWRCVCVCVRASQSVCLSCMHLQVCAHTWRCLCWCIRRYMSIYTVLCQRVCLVTTHTHTHIRTHTHTHTLSDNTWIHQHELFNLYLLMSARPDIKPFTTV